MLVAATLMPATSDHRFAAGAIAGVAVYCVATVIFAWVSYTQYEQDFRVEVEGRLTAIAELKAKEVAAWYRERSADARYFVDNESVLALIRQFDAGPPPVETVHALEDTFRRMQENHGYEWIGYYDADGLRLSVVPAGAAEDAHMVADVVRAAAAGQVVFLDLHNDDGGIPHFAIVAPVHSPGTPRRRPRGAVALRVDARRALTPFLSSWPIPAETAELLLVRRDGDDIVVPECRVWSVRLGRRTAGAALAHRFAGCPGGGGRQ